MENSKIFKKRFMTENLQTATVRQTSYAKKMGTLLAALALVFCLSFPVVGQVSKSTISKTPASGSIKKIPKEDAKQPPIPTSGSLSIQKKQTTFIGSDEEIVDKYLAENLPEYGFLDPGNYFRLDDNLSFDAPWLISADFDGNGHKDFAFIATKTSNFQLAVIVLNNLGNSMKHTILRDELEPNRDDADFVEIGLFLQEPATIVAPVDPENYQLGDDSEIEMGTAKHAYFTFAVNYTDIIFDRYWWEDGRYNSSFTKATAFREDPSNTAVVNTAQDALNLRAFPSLDAGIAGKLPRGSKIIILDRPSELEPWVKVLFEGQVGWVHGQYLTF